MSIREEFEKRERNFMSSFGCLSASTRGRAKEEKSCPVRTAFQLDRDRIVYSNGFRRLKHKTQVFLSPMGDDYRTRLTHTLEVAQMARAMARALLLNEDLAEAVAGLQPVFSLQCRSAFVRRQPAFDRSGVSC